MTQARWKATAIGVLVMVAGARARAQDGAAAFGDKGHVALSAERLFGFIRVFLSVAPTLELGLGGSTSNTGLGGGTTSTDSKETDYGVLCGLGGFL
jgi:hypothetical protein